VTDEFLNGLQTELQLNYHNHELIITYCIVRRTESGRPYLPVKENTNIIIVTSKLKEGGIET
jgi:hypothetical protein